MMKLLPIKSKISLISLWIILILPGIILPLQTVSAQKKKSKKEAAPLPKPIILIADKGASFS